MNGKDKKLIIAIDLGGTNLKIAIFNSRYKILDRGTLSTKKFNGKSGLINAIVHAINGIMLSNGLTSADIRGIGLGLPGPVDATRGIVHFFPNIPGWKNVNLKKILQSKLKIRIYIDNDANLMCLAEQRLGAARGANHAICMTLGTGVGGGIIIDRKLYRGRNNVTGEIGHIPLNEDGPECGCGGKACLEAYVGNSRVLYKARQIFGNKITLERLSELARRGNRPAKSIWKDVGEKIGLAVAGIVNLLNPDCVVIGGGMAEAGSVLFKSIIRTAKLRAMPVQSANVKIVKAKLGSEAGLFGAAILVKEGG